MDASSSLSKRFQYFSLYFAPVINTLLGPLVIIGLVVAAFDFKSARSEFEKATAQALREYAMHLYESWRDVLDQGSARESLIWITDRSRRDDSDLIASVIDGKVFEDKSEEKMAVIRRDVVSVLNLFEQIAVAYRDDVGDTDMILRNSRGPILFYYSRLGLTIDLWSRRQFYGWDPLVQIANEEWDLEEWAREEREPASVEDRPSPRDR
ncbi:MAG: hypothetical protein V3T53_15060 [Phycisphaerales bacterium]